MSLDLHDRQGRRRRRARNRWVFGLGAIIAAGVFAYQAGLSLAEREVEDLKQQLASQSVSVEELERQNTALRADLARGRVMPPGHTQVF